MTISTPASSVTVAGNGATAAFNFSFIAGVAANVVVTYTDANSNATVLVQGAQYTLSINAPAAGQIWGVGGTVTYPLSGAPIAAGTYLTTQRIVPFTQLTSISNQGDFYPQAVEQAMDTLEMQIQQVEFQANRALLFNIADVGPFATLPIASVRAGMILGFDSTGNPGVFAQLPAGSVSSAMVPVVASSTLADGVAALFATSALLPVVSAASIDAAWLTLGQIPATGQFYESSGAIVNRLNDRVFIGAAGANSGNLNGTGDYVTANIPGGPTTSMAQGASFSTIGGIGFMAASRTSDATSLGSQDGLAFMACVINDNTTSPGIAEAGYFEAQQKPGTGITTTVEIDAVNQTGTVTTVNPYSSLASPTEFPYSVALGLAAGGARSGVSPSSAAVEVGNNGTTFDKGIVFLNESLSGGLEAVALPQNYSVQWWGSIDQPTGFIVSSGNAQNYGIVMADSGVFLSNSPSGAGGSNSVASFAAMNIPLAVNYVTATGAVAGSGAILSAAGGDTNIDLIIQPKGAGLLQLGGALSATATAGTGALPAGVTAFLTVKSPTNGATYKIPLYNV